MINDPGRAFFNHNNTALVFVPFDSIITVLDENGVPPPPPYQDEAGGSVIGLYNNTRIKIYQSDVPFLSASIGGRRKTRIRRRNRKQKTNRKSRKARN